MGYPRLSQCSLVNTIDTPAERLSLQTAGRVVGYRVVGVPGYGGCNGVMGNGVMGTG